jgi:hypothetical protein
MAYVELKSFAWINFKTLYFGYAWLTSYEIDTWTHFSVYGKVRQKHILTYSDKSNYAVTITPSDALPCQLCDETDTAKVQRTCSYSCGAAGHPSSTSRERAFSLPWSESRHVVWWTLQCGSVQNVRTFSVKSQGRSSIHKPKKLGSNIKYLPRALLHEQLIMK